MLKLVCRGHRITEQIVIGTHGKLKSWVSKRQLDLRQIQIVVFDEADQMLDVSISAIGTHDPPYSNGSPFAIVLCLMGYQLRSNTH